MESANMAGRNVQTYTLENKNTLRKLATLRNEGQLCDLMFIFPDGSQIEAHKAIVCQYSSVIKARCVDIDQHKLQVLCSDIDNEQAINPSILNIMLDYIYGLSITIRQEYIQDIMRLAIKLNIPEFLGDCDKILFENKALGPSDLMINAQNIKQEQTGSGYETGQVSDFGMADQPLVTPSTSFDGANLQEPIDEKAAKPPGRRKRKATKVVKASVEQLPEPQSDEEDDMMDNPLDDDTDEYEADNFTAIKAEEADSDYNESASPKKRKRSKAKKTTVSTKRSHQKKTATLDPLFCKECDQKFDAYKDAAEHHKGAHNLIVCDVCAKIFDNEADLRRHSVLHSERILVLNKGVQFVFICHICQQEFYELQQLTEHTLDTHEGKIRCNIGVCKRVYSTFAKLCNHILARHYNKKYVSALACTICGKNFENKSLRERHEKQTHLKESCYICTTCKSGFSSRSCYKRHYIKNTKCFDSRPEHFKYHICDICGMMFICMADLTRHRGFKHTTSMECHICQKTLPSQLKLGRHMEVCHNKNLQCSYCGKAFGTADILRSHMRIHTGEKPYKCDLCDLSFTHTGSLSKHKQSKGHIENSLKIKIHRKPIE